MDVGGTERQRTRSHDVISGSCDLFHDKEHIIDLFACQGATCNLRPITVSASLKGRSVQGAAQRPAVQRRVVGIGTTLSIKPPAKMAPISWRNARPLQRRVRRPLVCLAMQLVEHR